MTSYRFSRWQLSAMMYLLWSTAGRTTHVPFMVWTRSSNRLFVNGLIVPEILRCIYFGVLAWNCLFTPLFGEFLGHIFPIWRHLSSWPPKGPSLGGNTSFEPFSVRIGATVRPGRMSGMTEKNYRTTKKSQKCYISHILGKPPLDRFDPKVARWVTSTT